MANEAASLTFGAEFPDTPSHPVEAAPRLGVAQWYLVGVLSLSGVLASADRVAMSLIITPIKEDLHISDFQSSLLLGFAFSVLFSLATIPAGHLVDLFSRKKVLTWSVAVWSAMAALCGLASNYFQLFLFRMGLGIGEGGSTPAAVSMIRDSFPGTQRGKAFAVYHATPLIGGGAALMFGGLILAIAGHGGFAHVPVLSHFRPWQIVLIIHASLGIPVILLLLTLREPRRRLTEINPASFREALGFVRSEGGIFAPLWIGNTLLMAAQGGVTGWLPTVLHRAYGLPLPSVGKLLGPMQMVIVPLGGFVVGALMDRFSRGTRGAGQINVSIACVLITFVAVAVQPFITNLGIAAIFYAVQIICFACVPISAALVITQVAPGRLVGKLSAVSNIFVMLIGFAWGPTAVERIAALFTGPRALLDGLVTFWLICLPLGAIAYGILSTRLRRREGETY
jgi:MFS family permease